MLKIYGRANSINVRKVLWMCAEIGLPFEREDWGRGFRPTSEPAFQEISPFGVVPVIDDDGFILRESNTIVRYLAEKHGRHDLYPKDREARATCEAWMDWAASDFYDHARPLFHAKIVGNPAYQNDLLLKPATAGWIRQAEILEGWLAAHGPYVCGDPFTVGDIPVGLVLNRWMMIPFEKPALPALAAYYERLKSRTAYRAHGANGLP